MQRIILSFILLVISLGFVLIADAQDSFQSPLDQWYEEESIMNSDNPNNSYYTGMDNYGSQVSDNAGGADCTACLSPNPPPFCFEPGHPCDGASVPIDSGIIFLIFGAFLIGGTAIAKQKGYASLYSFITDRR